MQKSNVIRLRLTDLEKADWQKAAGGARLTSAWIRAVCNAEAARTRGEVAQSVERGPETPEAAGSTPALPIPNAKPLIVEAAIAASANGEEERREGLSESSPSVPAAQPSAKRDSSPPQCPRWMHHRPGTYCGACKKVIKK